MPSAVAATRTGVAAAGKPKAVVHHAAKARRREERASMARVSPLERLLLALPDLAITICLLVIPLVMLLLYSVWTTNTVTLKVAPPFTLENFASIMQPIYLQALGRSLAVTIITVAGCILLGFPIAYFISQVSGKLQVALLLAIMVPFWTSFVVRTYSWLTLLAPGGIVNGLFVLLHLIPAGTDLRYTQAAISIGMIYSYLPMMILPLYSTLEKLDRNLLAAAADLGKNAFQTFFQVVVPQARGGIAAGCLLVAIPALGEYTIPAILGGGKTLMIGNVIASEFTVTGNYSRGAALAAVLLVLVLLVIAATQIASKISRRRVEAARAAATKEEAI